MNEFKFTKDKLIKLDDIINDIEASGYIDGYLGYMDGFFIDSILYYLKQLQQKETIIKEAREYIKEHQRQDEFLNLNEWQTRDLLQILDKENNNE